MELHDAGIMFIQDLKVHGNKLTVDCNQILFSGNAFGPEMKLIFLRTQYFFKTLFPASFMVGKLLALLSRLLFSQLFIQLLSLEKSVMSFSFCVQPQLCPVT